MTNIYEQNITKQNNNSYICKQHTRLDGVRSCELMKRATNTMSPSTDFRGIRNPSGRQRWHTYFDWIRDLIHWLRRVLKKHQVYHTCIVVLNV